MDNMIKEAIVLAGGYGTRLQKVIGEIPKPLAPVNQRPFLEYLLDYLLSFKIKKVHLFVSYKSDLVKRRFGNRYKQLDINYVYHPEPPETGGSIKLSLPHVSINEVFVINGDTFFDVDLAEFHKFYLKKKANFAVALKNIIKPSRYGNVLLDKNNRIINFEEKTHRAQGLINGGVYLINKKIFSGFDLPEKFSIEKDFLEKYHSRIGLFGFISNGYFIDIGTPADYKKAQGHFGQKTILLDRDGVINKEIPGEYVKKWNQFEFAPKAITALRLLTKKKYKILVITNQRGIAKKIMTKNDLNIIHKNMVAELEKNGAKISGIYYCPHLGDSCFCRKPQPGLIYQAAKDHRINLNDTFFVGNCDTDMEAGRQAGCKTILINHKKNLLTAVKTIIKNA